MPAFVRWPGKIEAGSVLNGIVSHQDWLPTILAAAGDPDVKEKLLTGHTAGEKTFTCHIDGFNMLPYLTGGVDESPRETFFYISDDGDVLAIRHKDWKVVLMEQGLSDYTAFASHYVTAFERKWIEANASPGEPLLGTPDLQSLADLSASFSNVLFMRWAPVSLRLLGALLTAALVPALPLVFLQYPAGELAKTLFLSLVGL